MQEDIRDALKKSTELPTPPIAHYNKPLETQREEVAVPTKGVATKTAGPSELALAIATTSTDAEDTQSALAENTAMSATLAKSYAAKVTEYSARRKILAEEVTTISDTT